MLAVFVGPLQMQLAMFTSSESPTKLGRISPAEIVRFKLRWWFAVVPALILPPDAIGLFMFFARHHHLPTGHDSVAMRILFNMPRRLT